MTAVTEPARARTLLATLKGVMEEIGDAVARGDIGRLEDLLPAEEALLKEVAEIRLGESLDAPTSHELERLVSQIFQKNTQNSLLIQEQLALIHMTVRTLFPHNGAIDHLA